MKVLITILYSLIVGQLWAPARMHNNTIIYPTGHKYEKPQKSLLLWGSSV